MSDNLKSRRNVRVRYAPSPTGFLHIGNAQSALFNYLFARHYNGTMVLRIEDTDVKRNVPHGEDSQIDNLHWLGIDWDEGPDKPNPKYAPYHQTERQDLYHKYIMQLLDQGLAYKDYATEDELTEMRETQRENGDAPHYDGRWYGRSEADQLEAEAKGLKPSIRLHLPENHVYAWDDIIKGHVAFNSDNMGGDFIIEKSNGMPTYNFAVVVDDYLMDITDVLRGDDHIANTPKQIAVYEALGIEHPNFGHITLIYNPKTRKKLSKRDKETLQFISQYKNQGYLSEAIFNFIAFLGWSPVGEKEIFSRDELIKLYDPTRMSKSPAYFDQSKLDWTNAEYIKKLDLDDMTDRVLELVSEGQSDLAKQVQGLQLLDLRGFTWQVCKIYQSEVHQLSQIMEKIVWYTNILNEHIDYNQLNRFDRDETVSVLRSFRNQVQVLQNEGVARDFNQVIQAVSIDTGVKGRNLYFPLNVAFTGVQSAPQIDEILHLYATNTIIALLNKAITEM
ncbi:glutamate--tRNA ligase [Levilactobacillus cerevisiae]|uniref:glutamate--tRNA ligase n=1 Tax=Levilactobacillus cerevisiae TaxID=1704076 RepID=UPI000F770C67|nr:glutamate--tRNA ligase [Levilactobacillus cerevisiae]